jgi:acetate kinase
MKDAGKSAVQTSHESSLLLTINGGSSSIRFALYAAGESLRLLLHGKLDRIGVRGTNLIVKDAAGKQQDNWAIEAADHRAAVSVLLDWLDAQQTFASIRAVGHRVVHGMMHTGPELITPELLAELHRIAPYDPEHLPREIELIGAIRQRRPSLPQVACFDTAFHRGMPRVAKLLPIPRRYQAKGVERYGFHGLSYQVAEKLDL